MNSGGDCKTCMTSDWNYDKDSGFMKMLMNLDIPILILVWFVRLLALLGFLWSAELTELLIYRDKQRSYQCFSQLICFLLFGVCYCCCCCSAQTV